MARVVAEGRRRIGNPRALWRPRNWRISVRSAVISAAVVLVALTIAGAGLAGLLYKSLLTGVDDAAAGRLRDIASALQVDSPAELDATLLGTDQRVAAVQVIDPTGRALAHSQSAPPTPMLPPQSIDTTPRRGIRPAGTLDDMRLSTQRLAGTGYEVLVAAGTQGVESTVRMVVVLFAVAAPIVIAVSATATYLLVRRSMRSVEAIRARVADISTSDLTERVPRPNSRDEIAALAVTMNEMLTRIEAGHTAQRQFVGDASHELRSPLATMISALEVAAAHPHLFTADLAGTTLMPEAQRMRALVEDLLLLARADERGLTLRRHEIDLDDLAGAEVARLKRTTSLTIDTDLIPTRLAGDPERLSRVLRNLLDNATRHARSRVEIALWPSGGAAVLTVADDGPGVPESDRHRVFDRFVRLDGDRSRRGGGTGLGLAIVSEIVDAHGGSVIITDRPGGGAMVTVHLPLMYAADSSR